MSEFLKSLVRSEGKSCNGKNAFPREDSAKRAAADMQRKKKERFGRDEVFEHYKCAFCDGWHFGHRTNFNWIPASHEHHRLMMNHYYCNTCTFDWFTSTVFSTRILSHFPGIQIEAEQCVLCPKCKNSGATPQITCSGRKWVNLENIEPDSIQTLRTLWNSDMSVDNADGMC